MEEDGEEQDILFFNSEAKEDEPQQDTIADLELEFHDNILTPEVLSGICNGQDLSAVTTIELQINTEGQSLDDIGHFLPALEELRLDNSFIVSVRDLGCIRSLKKLWLSSCGLTDLDGIEYFDQLEELDVSNNQIEDVSPVAMHETLAKLDLTGNRIKEIDSLEFLESCPRLVSLRLLKNPIELRTHYRRIVCSRIPLLCVLDGAEVTDTEREKLDSEAELLVDTAKKEQSDADSCTKSYTHEFSWAALSAPRTPSSASGSRPPTGYARPGTGSLTSRTIQCMTAQSSASSSTSMSTPTSKRSPNTSTPATPPTPQLRPASSAAAVLAPPSAAGAGGGAPATAAGLLPPMTATKEDLEGSSDLTYGRTSLSGGFINALRGRKGKKKDTEAPAARKTAGAGAGAGAGLVNPAPSPSPSSARQARHARHVGLDDESAEEETDDETTSNPSSAKHTHNNSSSSSSSSSRSSSSNRFVRPAALTVDSSSSSTQRKPTPPTSPATRNVMLTGGLPANGGKLSAEEARLRHHLRSKAENGGTSTAITAAGVGAGRRHSANSSETDSSGSRPNSCGSQGSGQDSGASSSRSAVNGSDVENHPIKASSNASARDPDNNASGAASPSRGNSSRKAPLKVKRAVPPSSPNPMGFKPTAPRTQVDGEFARPRSRASNYVRSTGRASSSSRK